MKVLLINGSLHVKGSTFTALSEITSTLATEGVESDIVHIGSKPIQDCIACGKCGHNGSCVFNDDNINEIIKMANNADGFIFGAPVFYAHAAGHALSAMDRMFYAGGGAFAFKPSAAIAVGRRAGTTSALEDMNKYFTINQMPIAGSTYWNMVYGANPAEILQDAEGLQTMRNLAKNMAWLIKCLKVGKDNGIKLPNIERSYRTNFIR